MCLHNNQLTPVHPAGAAAARDSYLRSDRILEAALKLGADALHPGYGFLSENADFAEQCEAANVRFVGPPSASIRAMGDKSRAKEIMAAAKVPVVPGYHGEDQSIGWYAPGCCAGTWQVSLPMVVADGMAWVSLCGGRPVCPCPFWRRTWSKRAASCGPVAVSGSEGITMFQCHLDHTHFHSMKEETAA
jgi:biotin carboxylase